MDENVRKAIWWLGDRLREPSTYAGLAGMLALIHLADAPAWVTAITSIGVGVGSIIAIVMPEQ